MTTTEHTTRRYELVWCDTHNPAGTPFNAATAHTETPECRHPHNSGVYAEPEIVRAEAAERDRAAADSFDRSDTDGFLSQWASNLTAMKLRAQADLTDRGGMIEVAALFNLDGTIASTHYGRGEWGPYWVLNDGATMRYGKRFVSPSRAKKSATRRRNMRAKGFTVGTVRVRGHVDIVGSGTGLSGCASAYVATLPNIEDLKDGKFEIVGTDTDTDD